MITVYTKPACVQCDATKRHLDKLGLEYETIDITQDEEAYQKIVGLGFQAAPVVITKDNSWSGYQPGKINELAGI